LRRSLAPPKSEAATSRPDSNRGGVRDMRALFLALWRDLSGATAIEYALIAILISTVAIAAMTTIGSWVGATFTGLASDL
jgi:pilus assembly protein Flp/PilA